MQDKSNVGERIILQRSLDQAFSQGDTSSLQQLIEMGVNLNQQVNDRETALQQAVEYGDIGIVQLLLDGGADPNFGDTGYSPLWRAAFHGMRDIYTLLYPLTHPDLQKEAQAEFPNGLRCRQRREAADPLVEELITAAAAGDDIRVLQLIETGVDVNAIDSDGNIALLPSCYWGRIEVVRLLLRHGADPNQSDEEAPWITPLLGAIRYIEAAKSEAFKKGSSPEASEEIQVEIMRLLLQAGANVNFTKDTCRVTPLMTAVDSRSSIAVMVLLEAGAEINSKDTSQRTALDRAIKNQDSEIIQLLLNAKAI